MQIETIVGIKTTQHDRWCISNH